MGLFYKDKTMALYEANHEFEKIIDYLINKYESAEDSKILTTLICYSWYFTVESDIDDKGIVHDVKLFSSAWSKYLSIAMLGESVSDNVLMISGYSTYLHGFYIGIKDNEKIGIGMLEKSIEVTDDILIRDLCLYWLNNKRNRKLKNKEIVFKKLFDDDSILDAYFKQVLK